MIIKADAGYSLIMLRAPRPDQTPWAKELVRRYAVIAWEYAESGVMRPLMPFPTATDEFVLELPNGMITAYRSTSAPGVMWAENIDEWLGYIEKSMLENIQTAGSA